MLRRSCHLFPLLRYNVEARPKTRGREQIDNSVKWQMGRTWKRVRRAWSVSCSCSSLLASKGYVYRRKPKIGPCPALRALVPGWPASARRSGQPKRSSTREDGRAVRRHHGDVESVATAANHHPATTRHIVAGVEGPPAVLEVSLEPAQKSIGSSGRGTPISGR